MMHDEWHDQHDGGETHDGVRVGARAPANLERDARPTELRDVTAATTPDVGVGRLVEVASDGRITASNG